MKTCISCGMPLRAASDYPSGDTSKTYCLHCANTTGALKTYAEVHAGMTGFLTRTQGLDDQVAKQLATEMMANLPAWQTSK